MKHLNNIYAGTGVNKEKLISARTTFPLVILTNDSSAQNTNLILMEIPTTRSRRKSMPFLNTVILDDASSFMENLPETIIMDEVDVTIESLPNATVDDSMSMDIDSTISQSVYNENCNEFIPSVNGNLKLFDE